MLNILRVFSYGGNTQVRIRDQTRFFEMIRNSFLLLDTWIDFNRHAKFQSSTTYCSRVGAYTSTKNVSIQIDPNWDIFNDCGTSSQIKLTIPSPHSNFHATRHELTAPKFRVPHLATHCAIVTCPTSLYLPMQSTDNIVASNSWIYLGQEDIGYRFVNFYHWVTRPGTNHHDLTLHILLVWLTEKSVSL